MKKNKIDPNKVFKALADPTRREIFHLLVVAGLALPISEVCEHFKMSRQGVTKHIKFLHSAGMVEINESGRENLCSANLKSLKTVQDWLAFYDKFWDEKLDALDRHLLKKKRMK